MQITFAEAEFTSKKKQTRRDRLLADLESLVPWSVLESVIEPHYPTFYWLKVHFGHRKVRYRGLAKNTAQLYSLFALANLFLSRRYMPLAG